MSFDLTANPNWYIIGPKIERRIEFTRESGLLYIKLRGVDHSWIWKKCCSPGELEAHTEVPTDLYIWLSDAIASGCNVKVPWRVNPYVMNMKASRKKNERDLAYDLLACIDTKDDKPLSTRVMDALFDGAEEQAREAEHLLKNELKAAKKRRRDLEA
jgi:hypothetical protein